jgi:hypothetical protein
MAGSLLKQRFNAILQIRVWATYAQEKPNRGQRGAGCDLSVKLEPIQSSITEK